jgi:hypothetical protein
MPYGSRRGNPVVAALHRRDIDPRPPLQVANGTRADTMPGSAGRQRGTRRSRPTGMAPGDSRPTVPMLGEAVFDDEPGFDE